MIQRTKQIEIEDLLQKELVKYFNKPEVQAQLNNNKEGGHTMAHAVDTECLSILKQNGFDVDVPRDKNGKEVKRGHADIILSLDRDYFTNVKFGEDKGGQPNICSMRRLMDGISSGKIDSYYLLKVSFKNNKVKVYFFDALDYLEKDMIVYNGGTGQTMLVESKFKDIYKQDWSSDLSVKEKLNLLFNLYEKKMLEHIALKTKQLDGYRKKLG